MYSGLIIQAQPLLGSTITKGTVVDIVDADDNAAGITPSVGTAAETDLGFSTANGDQIYAITGTRAAPGTFLAFVGESQDINGAETAVLTGTGLTAGTDAHLIATEGYYSGSTACNSTVSACLQQINGASWIGTAGFSYPADSPSSFSGSVFASDSTPPAVTSITLSGSPASSATSVTFTVGFDESANNISTDDFSVTTASGSATGSVASVSASSGTSITVTVNSITGVGSIRLDLKASTNITDDAGNGNGTNGSVAAFSAGGTHTVAIPNSDGSLTASATVTEPVAINTTVDTVGEAINVFDFTLTDGGTTDGLAMTVSQIVVNVSGTSSDTNRANVTWRLNGSDASNATGTYNAGADTITFTGLSISIADGASEVYTVNAYYNDNTGLTEGLTYILSVDGDTDVTVGAGTQMGATSAITNSTGSTVDVVATTLAFTTQPAGSVSGTALTTQPVVTARDAFGNTDTGFTETVTLTEASAGALSGNAVAAVSGVATFTALNYSATADQQSFTLTANDDDGLGSNLPTTNANAVTSDVVATKLVFDTQPIPLSVNSGESKAFTTVPVVSAKDANNVVDTGYSTGITLAEVNGAGSATLTGTGDTDGSAATVTLTPSSGLATFTGLNITYTASGGSSENFNIQASSGGLSTSNSSQLMGLVADSDGSLTAAAGVTEPVAINTTVDTIGEATNVFDLTLSDSGSADGLAMSVSQIVVNVSGTSSDTQRDNVTWRLNGADTSNVTGTYSAGADTITFTGLSISVADGTSEVYTVNAYYNDNTGLTEGLTYILSVDGDTDVTVGAGTQMGATSAITNSTGSTVDVVATTLAFTTQPAGSVSGTALTTQPVVTARDAFGNTDTGFTETVTLTEASAGALSGNAVAAVSGVATFTALNYSATADQQSFTLTANDQDGVGSDLSTTNANAVTTDVVATKLVFTTQPVPLSVNSGEAKAFTTVPVVSAQDANNVIDTGYSTGITLAEVNGAGSATLTGTGDTDGSAATVTLTPSSGVSTFTSMSITYTASGGASENFNLQASSGGLSSANSSQLTGLVADSDGSLTAAGGVTEPVAIDTTLDTTGEAVNVFDFTLSDGGTADGNALTVSQIVLNVSGTASDTQRDNVTWRLSGNDASNVTGTYNAGADTITFTGLSISIADGTSEVYTVNAYYNDNTGLTEGLTYILSVDGDTDVTVGAGTQMGATSAITNSTGSTVDVVATTLAFTTQPAGSVSGTALTTQPVVTARDAFGNTDTGFTETVTLTEASAGALSGNAVAAVSGVATFTALNYSATADQQSFTLTANDQDGVGSDLSTTNANAVTSDVVASKLVFDTQPAPLTLNSGVTEAMTTVPVVSARDANNVLDTGYTTGITLTETGAGSAIMSGTADTDGSSATVTITPTAGASTFSGLTINYTASGAAENFNLQASSGVLSTSNSSQFLANTDTVNPRISDIFRAIPTNSPTNVDSLTWTIAFNEVVNNFDVTDVEVTGTTATVQSITPIGSSVYRVTVSGGDLATLNGTATLAIASGHNIADEAGNALTNLVPTVQNVNTFVVDNNEPTVAISGVSANSNAAFTATFTFSEAVTGFDATDITLGNATKGTFTATSSTVYTLVVTPTGAAVTIDVAANSAIDVASNGNTAAIQATTNYDATDPTVAISGVPANSNAAFTATFTFSEAVTGFDATDITLGNATKGTFTATSSTVYTLVVTPIGAAVTIDVAANSAIDVASNGNTAATQATTSYDATDPTVAISGVPANSNASFTATFTFSEAVTGFDATDITLGNAANGTFTATSSTVYTLVVTPTGAAVTIDVAANSAIDVASNGNTAAIQATTNYDATDPTVAISGVPANSNAAFTATFTFSEAVTGFDATDITLGNATKGTFTATSSTVYTLVITPTGAAVTVDVAANVAIDVASNGNTAAIQATTNYDATDPAVVISGVPADTNTAFTATFTFSEAVTGFDATDITLGNATKGTFVATSSTVYTLVVTPTGAAVTVDVAANRAIDVASNGNTVATQASSAFDNEAPTFAIGAPSVTTTRNGPVTYTLNYANADNITLALNNITLNKTGDADGTLALSGTDNSRTVTISDISGDGTLAISIAANSASDKAGNNAAAANSATVTVVSNQTGTLSISGNAVVGETLTASLADVDGLTDITVAYQWTSGGNNVGSSVDSYLLQASDVGKSISVNAQYTDQRGTAENINSSASDIVITAQSDAVNRISNTANQSGGTEPTVDDYKTAGISDVSDVILTRILPLINNAVARQSDSADVDDVTKLQALVDTILEGQDNDGDGLPNLVEGTDDTDKDGTTDREDTDSDNDGVADQLEVRLTLTDSDSDGIIDVLDADVGNDGQVDTDKVDTNFDGVDDALDSMAKLLAKSHANAQAIPAVADEAELSFIQFDQDQDQRPNHLDLDSDNDGVMDVVESGLSDINGDGKLDAGDTVITDGSQLLDGDADSLPNMFELKSDGISFDLIVNGLPETLDKDANGILDSTIDMDRDGIIDSVDNAVGAQGTLPDMDGDGIPNHADDDDDGDGILDVDENSQQQYFTGLDADADGIDDGVDQNINGVLEGTDANNNGVRDDRELADLDGDGIADYLDTDSDNDGVLDGQDIIVNVGYDVKSRGTGEMSIMMMLSLLLLSTFRYSRNIFRISTVLLLFLVTGVSHAQSWQVSLGLGQSILRPDLASGLDTRDGSDWAVQLGVGYRILPDWHVELRYSDLGDADIRGDQGRSALGYQTWVLDAKYQLPLLQGTAWSPYMLGGIAVNRLRAEDLKLEKKTDPSLMFGTGISYRFQEFKLNSELIRYSYDNAGWFIGIEKDF